SGAHSRRKAADFFERAQPICDSDAETHRHGGIRKARAFGAKWPRQHLLDSGACSGCERSGEQMRDRRVWAIGSLLFALFASCGITKNALRAQASVGTDEAIPPPEMIGEGVISTDDDELGGGVTPDG